jgi:hypothetical protein
MPAADIMKLPYELVDFSAIPGVPCPCGTARRGLADVEDFPGTIHVTQIELDAKLHYHKRLTETYFFLECEPGAKMQLNDEDLHHDPPRHSAPGDRPDEGTDCRLPQVRPGRRVV